MALITLNQACAHLRIDGVADADDLALKISAAEILAAEYLGRSVYASQQELNAAVLAGAASEAPMVCNDLVRAAVLLILGHLYANREDVITGAPASEIPMGSRQLLAPYRHGLGV